MMVRHASVLLVSASLLSACGPSGSTPSGEAAPSIGALPDDLNLSGIYEVEGVTTRADGADERRIAGTVILTHEGDTYTTTFSLKTTFPASEDDLQADVIGQGDGSVDGRKLAGTLSTQLVVAAVPGVDTEFAYIPRIVGARIASTSVAELQPDGTFVMEVENRPAEGETDYLSTKTRLKGRLVATSVLPPPGEVAAGRRRTD